MYYCVRWVSVLLCEVDECTYEASELVNVKVRAPNGFTLKTKQV